MSGIRLTGGRRRRTARLFGMSPPRDWKSVSKINSLYWRKVNSIARSIERMERKSNRYRSDFLWPSHECVCNENKTHNLASLTIDGLTTMSFYCSLCFALCRRASPGRVGDQKLIPEPMNLTNDETVLPRKPHSLWILQTSSVTVEEA